MRLRFIPIWAALALLAGAVGTSAQSTSTADARKSKDQPSPRQVKVAIDPRSTGEAQSLLIVKGFGNSCPNVSIVRDESEAEYVVLASESDPWRGFLLHYYITVYDKQGKLVFATDKTSRQKCFRSSLPIHQCSKVGPMTPELQLFQSLFEVLKEQRKDIRWGGFLRLLRRC